MVSEKGSAMNARMKEARKKLGLSQTAFGEGANLGQGAIKNIEYNVTEPNPRYFNALCKAYGLNYSWIETGEGDMFDTISRDEQIAAFVGDALAEKNGKFQHDVLAVLSKLDEDGWRELEKVARMLLKAAEDVKKEEEGN